MIGEGLNPVVVLGQLLVAVLFAFEGWTAVGAIAGELKKPERDLPVAIIGGVSIITAVYCIVNVAYLQVLPASELASLSTPASAVAIALFGEVGGRIVICRNYDLRIRCLQWIHLFRLPCNLLSGR